MSYLEDFLLLIEGERWPDFLHLWEEYCQNDVVEGHEVCKILKMIKNSSFAPAFGKVIETAIPVWNKIKHEEVGDCLLRLILDLQTTQSPTLATLASNYLSDHYKDDPNFGEKLRITGLRARKSFQGAITNFELLNHMKKGKFVFHTGGWGVGEVIEISLLQEHVVLEFEGIEAPKDLTFEKAFKNLIYLPDDHFLARRFGNPDALEKEGKHDHLALLHIILRDLGPKTGQELKEELCELVIPEEDWAKWWQMTRTKAKKDPLIQMPESSKDPFVLLNQAVSHEQLLKESVQNSEDIDECISIIYQYLRDFPVATKSQSVSGLIQKKLLLSFENEELIKEKALARKLQAAFLLEDLFPSAFNEMSKNLVLSLENVESVIDLIEILAFKKRLLASIRQLRADWESIFLTLFLVIPQTSLKEYIFKELFNSNRLLLTQKVHELLHHMTLHPDTFFWYFQKLAGKEDVPLNDQNSVLQFVEAYLILLHYLEDKDEHKELVKKMFNFLVAKRFAVVRELIQHASVPFLKEFLLLASKCYCFAKQDLLILQSLAEVVQPSLGEKKADKNEDDVIWTTQEGYRKIQEKVQELGTVEMIDNAREIEAARAHGDLRENSEYKFALERRSRLQAELHQLSRQLNQARILTKEDIVTHTVCPGTIVTLDREEGEITYILLGPWDADPDRNILSFQSKLAQAMLGHKKGDDFNFQGKDYKIKSIKSYLDCKSS